MKKRKRNSRSQSAKPLASASRATLPSDLILIFARLFDSANDVISFSLISKRFHSIVLSNIKDKNNKNGEQLLRLHTTRIIGIITGFDRRQSSMQVRKLWVHVYHSLPNGALHGTESISSFQYQNDQNAKKLIAIAGKDKKEQTHQQLARPVIHHAVLKGYLTRFSSNIMTISAQEEALSIMKHGARLTQCVHHFGKPITRQPKQQRI